MSRLQSTAASVTHAIESVARMRGIKDPEFYAEFLDDVDVVDIASRINEAARKQHWVENLQRAEDMHKVLLITQRGDGGYLVMWGEDSRMAPPESENFAVINALLDRLGARP